MKTMQLLITVGLVSLSLLTGCGERLVCGTTWYSYANGPIEPGTTVAVVPRGESAAMHDWTVHKVHIESCLQRAGMVVVPETAEPTLICQASYSMMQTDDASRNINHDFVLRFLSGADHRDVQADAAAVAEIDVKSSDRSTNPDKMIAAMTHLAFCGWPAENGAEYDAGTGW